MSDIINPILQWLYAHPHLAGLGTFIISAAESIAIIGTIVPGSVMMTAIGALAGGGVIPLYPTIIWAILGAIVGDGISYRVGYHFKDRLHYIWPFRTRPYLLKNGERFFRKNGSMSVFIGRFVGPVRALVPLVAGMLGMKPLRFYVANVLSAIGWAPAYMLPGILLGAASLELPPDIAVHAIFMMLLVSLFIILCLWLVYKFLALVSSQINSALTRLWTRLGFSPYFRHITTMLKHHNLNKTYGQLTLAFYFLVICTLFAYLLLYVMWNGSESIYINNALFYLARSLRTPVTDNVMLAITFLGESKVLLPLTLTLFIWLGYTKRWRTALHVLALGIFAVVGTEFFKHLVNSPRPWGILHSPKGASFPSGHATLSIVYFIGIGLLLVKAFKIRRPRMFYGMIALLILAIGVSRIYLNAHWFTDVLGGWLLGAAILTFITLSYNRKTELPLPRKGLMITIITTLLITYSTFSYLNFDEKKENYSRIDWPTYNISETDWWSQQGDHLPVYRINRFGFSDEILSIQWISELSKIQDLLLKNGWEIPRDTDWISVLHRLSDVQSTEHLPLVSPLYLDKKPSLVLIKHINGNKKFVVLRLWDPHVFIENSTLPLWVGTVNVVPRTYSWLYNHNRKQISLTPELLFNTTPPQYEFKQLTIQTNRQKDQTMILIKPKP